jgi:hypothetical protein
VRQERVVVLFYFDNGFLHMGLDFGAVPAAASFTIQY